MSRWRWSATVSVPLLVAGAVLVSMPLLALGASAGLLALTLLVVGAEDRRHARAGLAPERRS